MTEPIPKTQMTLIDRMYLTPSERASKVHELIQKNRGDGEFSDWDIICYCIEYLGAQALVLEEPEFLAHVAETSRWVYSAHYSNPGRLYGKPDRERK